MDSGQVTMFLSVIKVTISEKILPKEPASFIYRSLAGQANLHEGYAIARESLVTFLVARSTHLELELEAAIT